MFNLNHCANCGNILNTAPESGLLHCMKCVSCGIEYLLSGPYTIKFTHFHFKKGDPDVEG